METAERLTRLEEQLRARPDGATPPGGGMAGAPDSVLLMEGMERLAALEQGGQDMERRLNALEERLPAGHGGETLLMETAERLTRLEERLQALWARQEAPAAAAPAAGDSTALEQRVAALEHQLGDLMTDFDKYVEKAAAAAAARILHEEIRRLMAERT